MKLMVMHKVDAAMEAGGPPSQSIIEGMGRLVQRSAKAGIFLDGAGLHRSASRARITFVDGKPSVERGPYQGRNELVASFAMIATTGIEKALELATQLGEAAGHREIEVGPVVEIWDLSGGRRPADAPWRFLFLVKADAGFEAGAPPPPAIRTLLDRWKQDGLLQSNGALAPSAKAQRLRTAQGKRTWIDGPFAESKELIAGYSIIEIATLDEAKRWTEEYADILGDTEVDVRPL